MRVARMRLPCLPVLLMATVLVSCARPEQSATSNAVPRAASSRPCVNLNTASIEELIQLPGIGEVLGRRIVEHRQRHGPFRRPEEIIIIEGFSEQKYRALATLICVE